MSSASLHAAPTDKRCGEVMSRSEGRSLLPACEGESAAAAAARGDITIGKLSGCGGEAEKSANLHLSPHTDYQVVSRRKKLLLLGTLVLFTSLLLLIATFFTVLWKLLPLYTSKETEGPGSTCSAPVCAQTALYILKAMNASASPCEDFYEYACGNWVRENALADDEQVVNLFQRRTDDVDIKLRDALAVEPQPSELDIIVHTKRFYQSCLNETVIDSRELGPLSTMLTDFGWPNVVDALLNNASAAKADVPDFRVEDLMAAVRIFGTRSIFDVWVAVDDRNSTVHSIYLDQGDLSLVGRDYFVSPSHAVLLDHYEKAIAQTVEALGDWRAAADRSGATAPLSKQQAESIARAILNVEKLLADNIVTAEERRKTPKQYNSLTIDAVTNLFPKFSWHRYVSKIFEAAQIALTPEDTVVVPGLNYLQKSYSVYEKILPHEAMAYTLWRFIFQRLSCLGRKERSLTNEVHRILRGTVTEKDRWQTCLTHTSTLLPQIVARIFLQETQFDLAQRAEATLMIRDIKGALIDALNVTEWMEEQTRYSAVQKAKAMEDLIGFPDYLLNNSYLLNLYSDVAMHRNRFFENYVQLERFKTLLMLRSLHTFVDRSVWTSPPASINAFHSSNRNQITLPAGILHPPFYHADLPKAVNYGKIGMIIGHEITHGFDDRGRQYDSHGNLRNWWSDRDAQRFKQKAQCIIEQYSQYYVADANMTIRGAATQGENIADNGGLKYAFKAYKNWVQANGEDKKLPGIKLSNDQVFFLSFGQIWCENRRKESAISRLLTVKHSPHKYRVVGTLSNLPEFSKTYNCPLGSPMNPHHKCSVW